MLARLPARAVPWGTNGEDAVSYRIRVASARKIYKYASTAENFPRPPELCAPDQWPHLTILAFIVLDEFTLEASSAFIFFLDVSDRPPSGKCTFDQYVTRNVAT